MAIVINTQLVNENDEYLLDAKSVKGSYVVVNNYSELANLPSATVVNGSLAYCVNSYTDTNVNPNVTYDAGFYQRTTNAWNAADLGGSQIVYVETSNLASVTYAQIKALLDNGKIPIIKDTSSSNHNIYHLMYDGNNSYAFASVDYFSSSGATYGKIGYLYIRQGYANDIKEYSGENMYNKVSSITNDNKASTTNYPSNKAIVDFVNSSINNIAAYYITRNAAGDPFETYAQLAATSTFYNAGTTRTPTQNDYTIVLQDESQAEPTTGYTAFSSVDQYVDKYVIGANSSDATTYLLLVQVTAANKNVLGIVAGTTKCWDEEPKATSRYIFQGEYNNGGQWEFQYVINNSGLTQAQLNAINSGITSAKVSQYDGYASSKQNVINGSNKLLSDYVDDTSQTNKFVTQAMYDYLDNQLYQPPSITVFNVKANGTNISTSNEFGKTYTASSLNYTLTNKANVSGDLTLKKDYTILQTITPQDSDTVNFTTNQTVSSQTTFRLEGTNTKGNTFTRNYTINFYYYVYVALNQTGIIPTTSLTRKNALTDSSSTFTVDYNSGDYIYFYHRANNKTLQYESGGNWYNVQDVTISSSTVSILLSTGINADYYVYQIGPFQLSGSTQFRFK